MDQNNAFLVATSGSIKKFNILKSKENLRNLGFNKISHRKDILEKYFDYAGDYKRRAEELNEAYASSANVIFCVIGGMGAIQILPYLDYKLIRRSNKILVGFSDVTILLNSINQITGARCLHGPNIGKKDKLDEKTISCLKDSITKKNYVVSFKEKDILKKGKSKSKIIGGNLELVGRSLGTPFEIKTEDKIIFIEDYDMKSWRVLDVLWQLKIAGKFNNVNGIILGKFTKCGKNVDDYIKDFFKNFNVPIIFNQEIGHERKNLTIPIGETCILDTEKKIWKIKFN